ncbi:MAG: beta-propeller domain-containing protein, partial [Halioglobus sp.]|nr:beta-propeller domain-containing protein [Halioglobus sp.]
DRAGNEAVLDSMQAADLLPEYSRDGLPPQPLVEGSDCYVPNGDYDGPEVLATSGSIITITAIDLAAPDSVTSVCLNGYASGYYMSVENLYLTTSAEGDRTLIHKIALNGGQPQYRGSGEVIGYLGTASPSFLMSEHEGDLRVVSSVWGDDIFPIPLMPDAENAAPAAPEEEIRGRHHLTVLRENPDAARLELVARLPNDARPAHIGKPGEDLYAARFVGDRAYLVTFEVIDPLYVLDLADPQDPRIAGELELPGFSTLLQPLGASLLLGVGQEVPPDTGLTQGVKIALFDVANLGDPVELGSDIVGKRGSYSPALGDHHALTLLENDGGYRLAVPISRHAFLQPGGNPADPWTWYGWSDSALYQYSVDTAAGTLRRVGTLVSEQRSEGQEWPLRDLYRSRSVIHDDAVYFLLQNSADVLSALWGE